MNSKLQKFLPIAAVSAALGFLLLVSPAAADQVIPDDLIVQQSLCVGFDCVNNENFGFDTIRLKENNLRIKFEDTSAGSFPTTDWELTANDSASGGAGRFTIRDVTAARDIFTVRAGAAANSIFVDGTGRVGLRTSTPVLDLHITTSNTPAMRLEQNNSGGFTAQTWDVAGNEANFFVRDVTSGSRLPFRIRPGAPTSSVDISADGDVGIGTGSPGTLSDGSQASLHVSRTDGDASIFVEDTQAGVNLMFELKTPDFPFFRLSNNTRSWQLGIGGNGFVIDDPAAGGDSFEVRNNGDIAVAGTVVHSSDRNLKQDVTPINPESVLEAIAAMDISTWSYKRSPDVRHLGPMAQDFYAAFQLGNGETTISSVDADGVALAGIKGLYLKLQEKEAQLSELRKRIEDREAMLDQLAARNVTLAKRVENLESMSGVAERLARLEALLGVPSGELVATLAAAKTTGN